MEIWLIRDGEKYGPFPDYTIRERIQNEELDADTSVWHEGLPAWTKLGEMELFQKEFNNRVVEVEVRPPPLPRKKPERIKGDDGGEKPPAYVTRRFWARWTDLTVYGAVWWLGMYFAGRDIGAAIGNPWILLTMYLPWFVLESWLIQKFGTTPGKWLLGLKVENEDGSPLALKASIWRSMRVLVSGIGFGWGFLSPLCQVMSWFTTRRIGKPIWDYLGGHKIVAEPTSPFRIMAVVFIFVGCGFLRLGVQGPHVEKAILEENPELTEYYEVWHSFYFPEKN